MKNTHLLEESENSIPGISPGSFRRNPAFLGQPNKLAVEETIKNTHHHYEESDNGTAVSWVPTFLGQPKKEESDHQEHDLKQKPVICGQERMKRHREEVAGKVSIPENWGKEGLLKDWIDFSAFDAALTSKKIYSARASLMADAGTGVPRQRLRVETTCMTQRGKKKEKRLPLLLPSFQPSTWKSHQRIA